jgi:hypothetical protein
MTARAEIEQREELPTHLTPFGWIKARSGLPTANPGCSEPDRLAHSLTSPDKQRVSLMAPGWLANVARKVADG